jgi:anti-anti-sigma regulatory factor
MALPPARITLAVAPPHAVFKIAGRAAVERARDFKAAVENLGSSGIRDVYLDLSECLLMDSMFSGILANLARGPGPRFTLLQANARITDLLDNLGALRFVRLGLPTETIPEAGSASAVDALPADKRATAECCLEAHRFLMGLKVENQTKFETLEKYLEAELRAMPAPAAEPPLPLAPAR